MNREKLLRVLNYAALVLAITLTSYITVRETVIPSVHPTMMGASGPQLPNPPGNNTTLTSPEAGVVSWNASSAIIREPPIDSFSALRWKFEENGQPFLNTGGGGTMSLTISSGTACAPQKTGIFNHSLLCNEGSSEYIESVTSPAVQPGTTAVSWWMWVWPFALNKNNATYMLKEYSGSSWSSPYETLAIAEIANSGTAGVWCCDVTTNGTLTSVCTSAFSPEHFLLLQQWNFLLCTWDSATGDLAQFHNASNTGAGTGTGTGHNLDYGGGTGRWGVCGSTEVNGAGASTCSAFIDDVGVDTTNRCPGANAAGECTWAQQIYQLGTWGTLN